MKRLFLFLTAGAFFACSAGPSAVLMVHPVTGERVMCEPLPRNRTFFGGGSIFTIDLSKPREVEDCVEQHQAIGFVKAEDPAPEQRGKLGGQ